MKLLCIESSLYSGKIGSDILLPRETVLKVEQQNLRVHPGSIKNGISRKRGKQAIAWGAGPKLLRTQNLPESRSTSQRTTFVISRPSQMQKLAPLFL